MPLVSLWVASSTFAILTISLYGLCIHDHVHVSFFIDGSFYREYALLSDIATRMHEAGHEI
jgi:hypothetical protein